MKLRCITDLSADIPEALAKKYHILQIPVPVTFPDGESYSDLKAFYDLLRKGKRAVVGPIDEEAYYTAFCSCAEQGETAVYCSPSGELSHNLRNAEAAKARAEASYPEADIYILDSREVSFGLGLPVLAAAKEAAEQATEQTEAAKAATACAYTKLGIGFVTAACFTGNHRSYRVLEKCGFIKEGVLHFSVKDENGSFRDEYIFYLPK